MIKKYVTKVRATFIVEALGLSPNNTEILTDYIASKAPDASSIKEEVEALGVEGKEEQVKTVFPRTEDGEPFFWDYQLKGFFKDVCGMLKRVSSSECYKVKAYKKVIDGLLFIGDRMNIIKKAEGAKVLDISDCQRPLRASTPQGERIALAISETVPAGSYIEFEIVLLDKKLEPMVMECLEYGEMRGLSQWRNSGKGRFTYEILDKYEIEE